MPMANSFSAIQNNSDLSQGLSPRWAAQSTTRAVGILMPLWSRRKQIKVAGDPRFDWATRRCAMNMSVTQFVVPPAIVVGRSRSIWHEIIDTVIEGPPANGCGRNRRVSCTASVRFITDVAERALPIAQTNPFDDARDRPDVEGSADVSRPVRN